jgi:pimeloyl-ACP methyl ester carboxylesterase
MNEIAFRRLGSGPPLVLLHGFLCDSRVWRTQFEGLSGDFDVIAWDAPGAGRSPDPHARFTIEDWARSLSSFLDSHEIGPAHVAGVSWGGMLAQELYRLDSERVRSLILAGAYAGWKGSLGEDAAAKRLERCRRESELPPEEFVPLWVPEFFTEEAPQELFDEMANVVRDFHPHGFRLMAESLAETDMNPLLPEIAVPTLLVWGEEDIRSPLDIAVRFHDAIPNAELIVIPNCGHLVNMERPDEFNQAVRRFASPAR